MNRTCIKLTLMAFLGVAGLGLAGPSAKAQVCELECRQGKGEIHPYPNKATCPDCAMKRRVFKERMDALTPFEREKMIESLSKRLYLRQMSPILHESNRSMESMLFPGLTGRIGRLSVREDVDSNPRIWIPSNETDRQPPESQPKPNPTSRVATRDTKKSEFNPIILEATISNGQILLVSEAGTTITPDLLPYFAKAGTYAPIISVQKLSGAEMIDLKQSLDPAGQNIFTTNSATAVERWGMLRDWNDLYIWNDRITLEKVMRFGQIVVDILNELKAAKLTAQNGGSIRFVVGHQETRDAKTLDDLIADAEHGKFKGLYLIVGICNLDMEKFLKLQEAALTNGALGCVIPTAEVNVVAMALVALRLRDNPGLMGNATPREALRRGYADAAELLRICLTKEQAEMEALLGGLFGSKSLEFFRRNRTIDQDLIKTILEHLLCDADKFLEFVDRGKPKEPSVGLAHGGKERAGLLILTT